MNSIDGSWQRSLMSSIDVSVMKLRNQLIEMGLDRVQNFIFFAWGLALFITVGGFWFGVSVNAMTVYWCFGLSLLLAAIVSWKMAVKVLLLCGVCLAACMYTFSYCGIDASVCHVPMQRLLNEGWNPVLQGTLEKLSELTGGHISMHHTLCMPKTVQLTGAMIAKATGLYVADTWVHYFCIYVIFAAAFRFAAHQWGCGRVASAVFGLIVTFNSQIGTMMGSAVDYPQYACVATAILSFFTWKRTKNPGDMFLAIVGFALAATIKLQGFFIGLPGLLMLLVCTMRSVRASRIALVVAVFVIVMFSCPYIATWVRYGSPFYPAHTFNPSTPLVDITVDFTSNDDGASMGYLARIVYAWFSTKLACLGCAIWQGKDAFSPEFYVPVGVDGLKTWFRVLMWLALGALVFSRKNRITALCVIIFVLMNMAPLRYVGFGRYFMVIWLIPPLALYNSIYEPLPWMRRFAKYAKYGVGVSLFVLAAMVATKTFWLWLRDIGMEGARQIVFQEAIDRGVLTLEPSMPMRRFGVNERYKCARKMESHSSDVTGRSETSDGVSFAAWMDAYMPEGGGFSISPKEAVEAFPRCDAPRQFFEFDYRRMFANLPHVLWDR